MYIVHFVATLQKSI